MDTHDFACGLTLYDCHIVLFVIVDRTVGQIFNDRSMIDRLVDNTSGDIANRPRFIQVMGGDLEEVGVSVSDRMFPAGASE
jgi:hypothetical protein